MVEYYFRKRDKSRPSRITVPERCHPLAKVVFAEMQRQGMTYLDIEWKSGVLVSTLKAWRKQNRPGLETIEATLGALGWSVLPVPRPDILPPELRADLASLAERHGLSTLPCLEFISAAVGYRRESAPITEQKRAA
jgi:hypothetical protein